TGPYAIKPIRDHLRRFSPAETPVNTSRRYSLTYDIIHWSWKAGKRETFSNSVIGRVVIQHEATDNQASYKISQRVAIGGVDNFLEAEIVCDRDDWDLLRYWTLRTFHTTATGGFEPLSELAEKGRCSGGQIRIESSSHAYAFSAENPVATQWSILDFLLRKADASSNATFDLLQDLSLFKPNHSLTRDGTVLVKLEGGKTVPLQAHAHTGRGILPTHYLLDDRRRPQLVTSSIVSWALSDQTGTAEKVEG
ncbi:MAG: hypothetical protein ACYTAO_19340, partial [Planctomycetota bacterium]